MCGNLLDPNESQNVHTFSNSPITKGTQSVNRDLDVQQNRSAENSMIGSQFEEIRSLVLAVFIGLDLAGN